MHTPGPTDTEANAGLIAAAPDLLALAHRALTLVLQQQCEGTTFHACAQFIDEARAAIAKAESKQDAAK